MSLKTLTYNFLRLALVMVLWVSFSQCSTKKNTFSRRVFHNLTGHYNLFWNGRESLREGEIKFKEGIKENYNQTLYVYNYGKEEDASLINSYADVAIEKASINIEQHTMYFEHKEQVRWIDDSYFLIGKSYFYKHEYRKAKRTFDLVYSSYSEEPIRHLASLWTAKTYIQMEKYGNAISILNQLTLDIKKDKKAPKNIERDIHLNLADLFLHKKKWDLAIVELENGLKFRIKKDLKARIQFILGQLYQKSLNYKKAAELYRLVIKKNPPYEMAIRASINRAQCYDVEANGIKSVEKQLLKLLKEEKNKDYRDQIYFALSDLRFRIKDDTTGINYLRLSVATSTTNNFQKVSSSLKLGKLYFDRTKYPLAQAYYDTAMQVLPEDYPNYKELKIKSAALNDLVAELIIIRGEDSLQGLARMDKKDLEKLIKEEINRYREEEEIRKQEEELARINGGKEDGESMTLAMGKKNSKWYFYNPQTVQQGKKQFQSKWGRRTLEDFWRISNKKSMQGEGPLTANSDTTKKVIGGNDPMRKEFYLQNIPFTEEQMLASQKKVEDAYYSLGNIYKDKMEDTTKAINTFEKLLDLFAKTEHRLPTYYSQYTMYSKRNNFEKAEYYKGLILADFPESDFAKVLKDPNYYKKLQAKIDALANLYTETYNHYVEEHYYTVNTKASKALDKYDEPSDLLSRFAFLKIISQAKLQNDSTAKDSLIIHLQKFVKKYANEEITPRAQEILNFYGGNKEMDSASKKEKTYDLSLYSYKPQGRHMYGLIVEEKRGKVNIEALKTRFTDFNNKNHKIDDLSASSIMMGKKSHFLIVGSFPNAQKALLYYKEILKDEYVLPLLKEGSFQTFIISQKNYPIFYKDKDLDKYIAFFNKNYLKKKKK
jgi:tetratricopeptide (TPR) repeat protein